MPTKGQPSGSSKKHAIEVDADPDIIEVDDDDDSDIEMLVAPTQGIVYKHPSNGSSRAHSKASTPNPPFKSGASKPQKAKKRVTTEKILIEISDDDEPSKTVSKPFHSLSVASHASETRIQSPQKRPREEGNSTSSHAKRPPGKKRRTEPPKGSPQPLSDHSLLPKVESSSGTLESSSDESDSLAYDAFEPVRLVFRDVDDRAIPSSLEADVPFDPDARHNTQPPGFNKSQSAAFKGISSRTSLFGPRSYSLPDGIDPRIGARQSLFSYDSPVRTNHGNVPRSLHLDKPFNEYELAKVFNRAAGAINKVVQRDGWIAACASSHGGGFDWAEAQADPYNRSETVLLWHPDSSRNGKGADSGDVRTFSPHCRTITRAGQRNIPPYTQHCTVVDIQFGPYGDSEVPQLVTAGEDGSVRVWKARFNDWDDEEESLQRAEPETFEAGLPQLWEDRCFARLLDMQVAARDVYIFALPDGDDDDFDFTTHLPIASKASTKMKGSTVVPHVASSYQWGRGPTDGYIYVSSESRDGYQGYHFEYPIETPDFDGGVPQPSSEFEDAKGECGDAMGIDEYGATLALVTASSADSHTLRLYDCL
ncbi:hypothetical protein DL96DRAFT_1704791 [Flagelloscypha sp. PMI_526]|nr:hypothetical protein DL96DRAFT_1704791 [Flagelloscypha sp. PMI_526]